MDKIGNLINQIKNAFMANHPNLTVENNKRFLAIADQLVENGIFSNLEVADKLLILTFHPDLTELDLKRVSKPGRRIYISKDNLIKQSSRSQDLMIISTSKGIVIDKRALSHNLGGEVICKVKTRFR